jgi:hemoglobin-like flavoprotein
VPDLSEDELMLFNDSFERCGSRPGFLERFYQIFVASSPEVAEKFRNTDIRHQAALLRVSLYCVMLASSGKPEGEAHLARIAKIHNRAGRDISPALYDLWLESLLAAVREYDPELDDDAEQAWRRVLAPGIEFLKASY